jgi:hypothetical protein
MNAQQSLPAGDKDRSARTTLVWGVLLVVVGGGALVSQFLPAYERYVPLVVGLGLLAIFAVTRSYLALVGACVLTGLGAGLVAADLFPRGDADGPGVTLGLGLGFISVWLISGLFRLKEHHFWPLIPGGILTMVGVGLMLDLFANNLSDYLIPAVVVALGIVLIVVGYLRTTRSEATVD